MKKLIVFMLVGAAACFCLVSCSKQSEHPSNEQENSTKADAEHSTSTHSAEHPE